MKILFIVYHGFSPSSGITKKIMAQVDGLRQNGHEVALCYYAFDDRSHRCRYVDGKVIKDYGKGAWAAMRQRTGYRCIYDYCRSEGVEMVYARSFHNASPWLITLFKRLRKTGVRSVTEIPTYPYDHEYRSLPLLFKMELMVDKMFRRRLAREMEAIVTFSDDREIFGKRTIRISNGVDFSKVRMHDRSLIDTSTEVHLIGVAEVHPWHGFDRLIAGLGEYYKSGAGRRVVFHVVGGVERGEMYGSSAAPGFKPIIDRYGISQYVVFHGQLFGEELDAVFARCVLAVGSLARHRSGIRNMKSLKNREYASRGLPFIYSEDDDDFDGKEYVMKVAPDETPVDIRRLLAFVDTVRMSSADIRQSVAHLSWKRQMQRVVEAMV